jgi:hypothetical protein
LPSLGGEQEKSASCNTIAVRKNAIDLFIMTYLRNQNGGLLHVHRPANVNKWLSENDLQAGIAFGFPQFAKRWWSRVVCFVQY